MNQYYLRKSNINRDIKTSVISVANLEQILFGKQNQQKYQKKYFTALKIHFVRKKDDINASEGHGK